MPRPGRVHMGRPQVCQLPSCEALYASSKVTSAMALKMELKITLSTL